MPRNTPAGRGWPQPAAFAVASRMPRSFGEFASSARRYSYGSLPAAFASSSMKDSRTNGFCECPTVRQNPTGTCAVRCAYSTLTFGIACGRSYSEATDWGSTPSAGANGRLSGTRASVSKIEVAATREYQATGFPEPSSPAFLRTRLEIGRANVWTPVTDQYRHTTL